MLLAFLAAASRTSDEAGDPNKLAADLCRPPRNDNASTEDNECCKQGVLCTPAVYEPGVLV